MKLNKNRLYKVPINLNWVLLKSIRIIGEVVILKGTKYHKTCVVTLCICGIIPPVHSHSIKHLAFGNLIYHTCALGTSLLHVLVDSDSMVCWPAQAGPHETWCL